MPVGFMVRRVRVLFVLYHLLFRSPNADRRCLKRYRVCRVYRNSGPETESSYLASLISWHFNVGSLGKRTVSNEVLATVTKAGRMSNTEGKDFFDMVPMLIPSTTPTMKSCRCIKISYQVKVSPRP